MADKSPKLHVEASAVDEENTLTTREWNLPSYLSDYVDVPGQNKLQTTKNRRKSMRANLTKKINAIDEYLKERKNRKLIELALTQLNRTWEQLIENRKEFQSLCSDDKELQDADTWLLESQAIVEELICRTVECQEDKIVNGGSGFSVPVETKKPDRYWIKPILLHSLALVARVAKKGVVKQSRQLHLHPENVQGQLQGKLI